MYIMFGHSLSSTPPMRSVLSCKLIVLGRVFDYSFEGTTSDGRAVTLLHTATLGHALKSVTVTVTVTQNWCPMFSRTGSSTLFPVGSMRSRWPYRGTVTPGLQALRNSEIH
jgi:hypothetical protein